MQTWLRRRVFSLPGNAFRRTTEDGQAMNESSAIRDIPVPAPRKSDPSVLAADIVERLIYRIGKDAKVAKPHDWLIAAILVVRDRIIAGWSRLARHTRPVRSAFITCPWNS
jgi:hypothetical protein